MIEHHSNERILGTRVLRRLGSHHSAFPSAEEKLRQIRSFYFGTDFAFVLCFLNAVCKAISPFGHNFFQSGAEDLALIRHFLTEIANQAAFSALCFQQVLAGFFAVLAQTLQRGNAVVVEVMIEFFGVAAIEVIDDLQAEVFFAFEIVVKRAFWNADTLQDFHDSGGVVAFLLHYLNAGFNKQGLGVGFRCGSLLGYFFGWYALWHILSSDVLLLLFYYTRPVV